jgi:hypothetical protein
MLLHIRLDLRAENLGASLAVRRWLRQMKAARNQTLVRRAQN